MAFPSASSLLIALVIAGAFTALHVVTDWMIRRAAIRRLHQIQDEMGQICQRRDNPDAERQMDVLAHEAGRLLARFDIDYWAVVRRGKDHRP
jgi:hypothetical protein